MNMQVRLSGAGRSCSNDEQLEKQHIFQSIIDVFTSSVAVLGEDGTVILVNDACATGAHGTATLAPGGVGSNYYRHCISASADCPKAVDVMESLDAMFGGKTGPERFSYEAVIDGDAKHFLLTLMNFNPGDRNLVLVAHLEVTMMVRGLGLERQRVQRELDVQEQERRRIARELHDSTSQHLAGIQLLLSRLRGDVEGEANLARIDEIQSAFTEALAEIRSFSYLLHPPHLRKEGLVRSLRQLIRGYARRIGLPIAFSAQVDIAVQFDDVDAALFRIVQEALSNVHHHADASKARVRLSAGPYEIELAVTDDGKGFDASSSQNSGVGIASMKARATELGGSLRIDSDEGGTRLTVNIPLHAATLDLAC